MTKGLAGLFLICAIAIGGHAQADIVERQMRIPVTVTVDGAPLTRDVIVTRFQDSARKPSRFMVILHGRAGTQAERAAYGRTRFSGISRAFAEQGYAVFVPTRIGYGDTGGPDIEITGRCDDKNYARGMQPATDQVLQLIAVIRQEPDIGNSAGVIVGQSVGGLLAVSLAARNVPRVVAYVNFAGGSGGDPKAKPGEPCMPDQLKAAFAQFGAKARSPVLWLYSANDLYWGAEYPHTWFAAFRKAGGRGQFVSLPPCCSDGHRSFMDTRAAWMAPVEAFLANPH